MITETVKDFDNKLSRYLKALGHPVRLSIIRTLLEKCNCPHGCNPCSCGDKCEGENCKCGCNCGTLVNQFSMSQSTVSQHIKELKSAGLINSNGRKGDYTINHTSVTEALNMFFDLLGGQYTIPHDGNNLFCC